MTGSSRKQSGGKSCSKGKILRKAYSRKAHSRKSYTRKSGERVRGSYVDRAKVPSTCVPDRGAVGRGPGKGSQYLPRPTKKGMLRHYGYDTDKSKSERESILRRASKEEKGGALEVLRHLNLIRNLQAEDEKGRRVKAAMADDIKFLSTLYAAAKRASSRGGAKRSRKGSKKSSKKSSKKASKKASKKHSRKGSRRH